MDAAIIFADLLLPLEVMGLPFHFSAGEGPVIERPVRDQADVSRLRIDRACDLGYVSEAVRSGVPTLRIALAGDRLLRRALYPGQLHDRGRQFAQLRPHKEDDVYLARGLGRTHGQAGGGGLRVRRPSRCDAGADVIQIFDSWVGCLSVEDYREYVLPHATALVKSAAEDRSAQSSISVPTAPRYCPR